MKPEIETTESEGICVMCGELGTLEFEEGKFVCETCAQIQGELAEMQED